jgi:hypothetical protein
VIQCIIGLKESFSCFLLKLEMFSQLLSLREPRYTSTNYSHQVPDNYEAISSYLIFLLHHRLKGTVNFLNKISYNFSEDINVFVVPLQRTKIRRSREPGSGVSHELCSQFRIICCCAFCISVLHHYMPVPKLRYLLQLKIHIFCMATNTSRRAR